MNRFNKILSFGTGLAIAASTALIVGFTGNASALACYQYDPSGNFHTSQTPVFNNICGDTTPLSSTEGSYPIGNEADFVRIRQNTSNGSPLGANNPKLVNSLSSACTDGNVYDIWTYVHNDAEAQYNNNGAGSAVAHNVRLALAAHGIDTTNTNFNFTSTISASNAASVSDSATLMCNGQAVKMTLVPHSVHINTNLTQSSYGSLSDSAVNGTTTLGNPTMGSGDVWGCWNYRTVVVYEVQVHKITPPPVQATATCDLLNVVAGEERKVKVSQFKYTNVNAAVKNVVLNWGDNSNNVTLTDSNQVIGQEHQYTADNTYTITAVITFTDNTTKKEIVSGGAGTACVQQVSYTTPNQPPTIVTPPTTPSAPTQLVNTGAGSVAGIFAATTAAGAVAYRWILGRRLSRQ